jgi:hypothetical protein
MMRYTQDYHGGSSIRFGYWIGTGLISISDFFKRAISRAFGK